jgi:hypothetical protein
MNRPQATEIRARTHKRGNKRLVVDTIARQEDVEPFIVPFHIVMVMVIAILEPDTIFQRRRNIQLPIQRGKGDIGWPWLGRRFLLDPCPLLALALGL